MVAQDASVVLALVLSMVGLLDACHWRPAVGRMLMTECRKGDEGRWRS